MAEQQREPRGHASHFRPKTHSQDATIEQRQMYVDVCTALASEPVGEEPVPRADMISVSCRAPRSDRIEANALAAKLGLTANACILTALRLGLAAMSEAASERG